MNKTNQMIARLIAYWRLHTIPIFLVLSSLALYFTFGHLLRREDTVRLLTLYAALFFFCFKLIQFEKWNLRFLLVTGILARLIFFPSIPNLSQDFYRFIWDGSILLAGLNPYQFTPNELTAAASPAAEGLGELLQGMGTLSARNFSNYPPLNQLIFALSVFIGGKGVLGPILAMRGVILLADLGILYFGRKLLMKLNRSAHLIFWYFLNPLVIIELSGNLHFEGVMLFFFVWGLYLLLCSKWYLAAPVYALSILIKLIPLLFLPLLLKYFDLKKSFGFFLFTFLVCCLFALPFLQSGTAGNYWSTLLLWFSNFEFNAGIYNLVKEISGWFDGRPWRLIKTYGKIIPVIMVLCALAFTFFRQISKPHILVSSMMWLLAIYYLLSPTVHPWYIIPLVVLCLFTDYRFPLFWSAVVMLSYSAYAHPEYRENLWLLGIEYLVVIGIMLYEIFRLKEDFFPIRKN